MNNHHSIRMIHKCDPREVDLIRLGNDPYVDRLYGFFRFDNPRAEGFEMERKALLVANPEKYVRVIVPHGMKIPLPEDYRVTHSDTFQIDSLGSDLDTMYLLTLRAGWNQTERDIHRIINLLPEGAFCARLAFGESDFPVATGVVSPLGENHAWIGMILVQPELRRQGIASAMMKHLLSWSLDHGKVINGLDATPMGKSVYSNLGYESSYRILRSEFKTEEFAQAKPQRPLPISEELLEDVVRYDASCWLQRGNVLRVLFAHSDGLAFYYPGDSGEIVGYGMGRPGRIAPFVGPVVADTKEIAKDLLSAIVLILYKQGYQKAFIDTPEIWYREKSGDSEREQYQRPSNHCLIKSAKPVRDLLRMYHVVNEEKAEKLVKEYYQLSNSRRGTSSIEKVSGNLHRAIANYSQTVAFMQHEQQQLQKKIWGTTGPEKG